jgi:hypothetical protein
MRKFNLLFVLLTLSISSYSQISKENLLSDYDFLVNELKAYHQGLYQYVDKNTVDQKIDSIRNTIESADKIEFFKKVNALIALTNEGHSGARLPFWTQTKFGMSNSFIPIKIEFSNKKAILVSYFGKENPGVEFGDQILSINGVSIQDIMTTLKPYVATDGFNETSFYQWVGMDFPLYYAVAFGKSESFDIEVKKHNSQDIESFTIEARSALKLKDNKNTLNTVKRHNSFLYRTISDSIGYLCVPNFYGYKDFEEFYLNSFKSIRNDKIKHLIIDIQENVGGVEGNENLLASYLFQKPFRKYKNVLAPKEACENFKNKKSVRLDAWTLKDDVPHRGEFTLTSNYFSELGYKQPDTDLIFSGKVYVLTSGVTFSGGAEFASMLKMTNRAIFIGEETGGTYEGNVSGYSRDVKLPKTKIKVSIPIVHFKVDVSPKVKGRGILPDHVVYQSWEDIIQAKNTKFEFALKLIQKSR